MPLSALTLVVVAAVLHAVWNLLMKRVSGGVEVVWLFTLVATVVYAPLALAVVVITGFRPDVEQGVFLIGTGALQVAYFSLLQRGYADGDLSVVYPVARGIGPVAATALAVLLLAERPSALTLVGTGVVTLGVLMLVPRLRIGAREATPLLNGVAIGVVIGGYSAWDGHAVGTLAVPALVLGWCADAGRMVLLTPVAMRRRDVVSRAWAANRGTIVAIGVLVSGSYLLVLSAFAIAPVSAVAPARGIGIVIATMLGITVLGERGDARRISCAVVITFGVALVAIG